MGGSFHHNVIKGYFLPVEENREKEGTFFWGPKTRGENKTKQFFSESLKKKGLD